MSSVLIHRDCGEQLNAKATVLALHGYGGDCGQLEELCNVLRVPIAGVLPQAWRSLNAHGFAVSDQPGQSWFFSYGDDRPEPATFGDSLLELEQLVHELLGHHAAERPLFLIGYDQGAVLALTLAQVIPDSLAGVVAICGYIPRIRGWSPPISDLQNLPVLLIDDPTRTDNRAVFGSDCEGRVTRLNGQVKVRSVPGVFGKPLLAEAEINTWIASLLNRIEARSMPGLNDTIVL